MGSKSKIFENAGESGPTLKDVAELIKQGKVKNIIFLCGAGISTSAGIPDFRSPETGLYANLEKYNLPYPEAIFDIQYLFQRPEAFYTLAKELYPGNFKPTLTHYFMRLVHEKKLLKRVFTQNVDTLEQIAGLQEDMIVAAHGSFATATCMNCKKKFVAEELKDRIKTGEVLRCKETKCKGKSRALIKSDIVFFGEALPSLFFKRMSDFRDADLLITIGTSLKVHPFASLIDRVDDECPRLLINLESVGEIDEDDAYAGGIMFGRYREEGFDFKGLASGGKQYARDVRWLGEADAGCRELAQLLGWERELDEMYASGHAELDKLGQPAATEDSHQAKGPTAAATSEKTAEKVGEAVERPLVDPKVEGLAQDLEKLDVQATAPNAAAGPDDPASFVAPKILLGNEAAASDLGYLQKLGVTHIVNVALECSEAFPGKFTYHHLPLRDDTAQRLAPYFGRVSAWLDQAVSVGGTVLLHCQHGISRSAAFALAHFMTRGSKDLGTAFGELRKARRSVEPNHAFLRELRTLERQLGLGPTMQCLTPLDSTAAPSAREAQLEPVRLLVSRIATEGPGAIDDAELEAYAQQLAQLNSAVLRREAITLSVCAIFESYGSETPRAVQARAGLAQILRAVVARKDVGDTNSNEVARAFSSIHESEEWNALDLPYKDRYLAELRAALADSSDGSKGKKAVL